MAELISEDRDCESKIVLVGGEKKTLTSKYAASQEWQKIEIHLISGNRKVETEPTEDVLLCRTPTDEIKVLIETLQPLLQKSRDEVIFEPSEPSFEFSFNRTRRGGIKVEAWIDAGNGGEAAIYTWDAAGIRFYTTDEHIQKFAADLKSEFGL